MTQSSIAWNLTVPAAVGLALLVRRMTAAGRGRVALAVVVVCAVEQLHYVDAFKPMLEVTVSPLAKR